MLAALLPLQKGIFPGADARWRVRYLHALAAGSRRGDKGLRGGDGKIGEIEDGNFETGKIKRHVCVCGGVMFLSVGCKLAFWFYLLSRCLKSSFFYFPLLPASAQG